ncbi:MAG: response regulator [Desulfosudaceae bacterium]
MDYRLPGCTGLDLLYRLRRRGLQQPFILLTGQEDHAVDLQAMEEGGSDYLEKDLLSPPHSAGGHEQYCPS